jgi:hypothetical protein
MKLKINSLLAEETGIHLGDGSMNFYNGKGLFQLRGDIRNDREYYNHHVQLLYKKLYGIKVHVRDMPSTGVLGFQLWSTPLVKFKHENFGLPLGKKIDIRIPEMFLKTPEFKISILRGVFDTDGCIYLENKRNKKYPRVEIRNTSETLIEQISVILKEFNFSFCKYVVKRKNPKWKPLHAIIIRGFPATNSFFKLVKPSNPKHLKKFKFLNTKLGEADNRHQTPEGQEFESPPAH